MSACRRWVRFLLCPSSTQAHFGQRVHPARAGQRNGRAGERHRRGHQDSQRPPGSRDHDGDHQAGLVRSVARRHYGRGGSHGGGHQLRCDDRGRLCRRRRQSVAGGTGHRHCPRDGIGRGHRWFHRRHVRWHPGSGDHLGCHRRHRIPRQPEPVAGRHSHRGRWLRRTGRDAIGTSGPPAPELAGGRAGAGRREWLRSARRPAALVPAGRRRPAGARLVRGCACPRR
jgi:hypothetical protein